MKTIVTSNGNITSIQRGEHWMGIGSVPSESHPGESIIVAISEDKKNGHDWESLLWVRAKNRAVDGIKTAIIGTMCQVQDDNLEFFMRNFNARILSMDFEVTFTRSEFVLSANLAQEIWEKKETLE